MASRKLEIVLSGDAKSALQAFSATEKGAEGLAGKVDKLGGQMANAGKKMTIGLTVPIVAGFGFAARAASNLNESVNVTGITFGKASSKIDAFVKTTAKGLGQSERAARDATAQFGGLLQNLNFSADAAANWSIDLTTLASDLGSAFNTDPADAVAAIGSAIRGETEPIRRYNVMLDDASVRAKAVEMGLAATTAEVDKNGKAQASLALIMEQTSKYQGDFANTSDGLANQQRILRARLEDTAASIGAKLLPVASNLMGMAASLVDGFAGLSEESQTLILMASGVAAAIGPITYVAGRAMQATVALGKAMVFLATTSAAASLALVGIGAVVVGGMALWLAYKAVMEAARKDSERFNDRNAELVNSQALVNTGLKHNTAAFHDQAVELFMASKGAISAADATDALAETQRILSPQIQEATRTLKEMSGASGVSEERIAQLANQMGVNLGAMSDEARDKLAGAVAEVGRAVTPTERLEGVTETLGNEFATAAESVDAFKEALDAALGVHLTAEEASIRLREKVRELHTELAGGAKEGESHAAMQDRLALAMIGVVEQAQTEVEALVRAGAISTDTKIQTDALRTRLLALREEFPGLRTQIDNYIGRLDAIPAGKATAISTPGIHTGFGNIGNWQRLLHRTPGVKRTHIETPGLREANDGLSNMQRLLGNLKGFARIAVNANLNTGDGPGNIRAAGKAIDRARAAATGLPVRMSSAYRSPWHNRAVGGSPTSYHMDRLNPASDWVGPTWALDELARRLRGAGPHRELLWRVRNHAPGDNPHVHYAHRGGMVSPSWPTFDGLRTDERPAVLQVGERVVPKGGGGVGATDGIHLHIHGNIYGRDMAEREIVAILAAAKRKGMVGA
ncbi:MAG: hypothetical protein KY452_03655 [Actinobacteria bacterium]|nr:hypothetical protein [Actinomycetota bacterium]